MKECADGGVREGRENIIERPTFLGFLTRAGKTDGGQGLYSGRIVETFHLNFPVNFSPERVVMVVVGCIINAVSRYRTFENVIEDF